VKGMGIKVLLVEDDRALREALADTLLLAGLDYKAVGSAEEALAAVGVEAFNLVVSDVNMPGIARVANDGSRRCRAGSRCDASGGGGLSGQAI
jgi:DNA-binding NtrC family response regulator